MANPIMEQINSGSNPPTMNQWKSQVQQAKQILRQIKSMDNPQAMMNQILMNNPNTQQVLNFVKQMGNSPQSAFVALAKQKGVNPQEFINELMSQ